VLIGAENRCPNDKMSSLAATQSDGYYLPPSYFESGKYKSKSISQFQNSKGHNQYLQNGVVRFELPFDGFCTHCQNHVGKGTRFNAHKKRAGNYFTTTIWEFRMKCRQCAACEFLVRTDPKGRTFEYVEGLKKKNEEWDVAEAGSLGIIDTESGRGGILREGSSSQGINLLEKRAAGKRKVLTEIERMQELIRSSGDRGWNDSGRNAGLRATYRTERKAKRRRIKEAKNLGLGEGIEILPGTAVERAQALLAFEDDNVRHRKISQKEKNTFYKLRSSSIFGVKNKVEKKSTRLVCTPMGIKNHSIIKNDQNSREICIKPRTCSPSAKSSLSSLRYYASDSDE